MGLRMARYLLCGAIVLLMYAEPSWAAPTVLTVAFTNACAANESVVATARRESASLWSDAGVTLRWVAASELPYRSRASDWIVVRCISGDAAAPRPRTPHVLPIAAIRFIGAQPTNTIVASLRSANLLLDRDAGESRALGERFQALRQLRLGRMLGRAIAHEIGHFLSKSSAHSETGLMRATHSVTALIGQSLSPFRIEHELAALAQESEASLPPIARRDSDGPVAARTSESCRSPSSAAR
jgi:hypothetical protein